MKQKRNSFFLVFMHLLYKKYMKTFALVLLMSSAFTIPASYAGISSTGTQQNITVSGTVIDSEGNPMPGVSVIVKGTAIGINTDMAGKYSIKVPSNESTLTFAFVGMKTSEIVVGNQSVINITMINDTRALGEVVITALGITRDKKTLGYAVQELNNNSLSEAKDNNIINTMSGKVAGIQVTSGGSTVGASSRIIIRGNSSFSGNSPLFVVDGTPIDNTATNLDGSGGVDWGNTASDIDANNIESMTVLKGANAAALYGSRATHGVILITTKKGAKEGRKLGVDVNSSIVINKPAYFPKFQNEYGGGWDGEEYIYNQYLANHPGSNLTYNQYAKQFSYNYVDGNGGGVNDANPINWGPRLDAGLKLDQWSTGKDSPWISRPDNYKDNFQTGFTTENSVAFSANGPKASGRLALTSENTTGIVDFTDQKQNTINTSLTLTPTDKLTVVTNFTYLIKSSNNIPNNGYSGTGVDFAWTEREYDTKYVQALYKTEGNKDYMWVGADNPYYSLRNTKGLDRERGYGNLNATYKITSWLSAMARGGVDFYTERRKTITQSGTASNIKLGRGGQFTQTEIFNKETNLDFILKADKQFGDIRVDGLTGANYRDYYNNVMGLSASDLTVPDLYTISNARGNPGTSMSTAQKRTNSVYAAANASYKDYLFVGVTGRNDWSSTLPANNRSYFYPSVSLGFGVTDAFKIKSDFLSYAKLRGSWAKVGGDTDPYQLSRTYNASTFNSIALFAPTGTMPPSNLKPESTVSYEFGAETRFLKNRLSLDLTFYDQTTVNQILSVASSTTTGYSAMKLNAGEIDNKGVEVMFTGKIMDNPSGLNWDITLNWATNKNMVNKLYGDLQSYQISAGFGGCTTLGIPGQPWGVLWGLPFVRNSAGKIVVGSDGIPLTTNVGKNLGNVNPDWTGGISNSFRFKNFVLSFLVDMRKGGKFFSCSAWHAYPTGTYAITTANNVRVTGLIVDGVKEDGTVNDIRVSAQDYFGGSWMWNNHEYSILDGTYVKLREVVFGYDFNVKRIPWIQKLNVSFVGRNLALLYSDKSCSQLGIDPEVGLGGGEAGVGFENFQIPTTRNYGFKVSVSF
jgi:TonB-linked SusC/RagA family outer membrane protein